MREFFLPFIQSALQSAGITTTKDIQIEKPTDPKFGDFSTNIAFLLARDAGKNPRELAATIMAHLSFPPDTIEKTAVAGPGFINFHLAPTFIMSSAAEILKEGAAFGKATAAKGSRAIVEYVSANPTARLPSAGAGEQSLETASPISWKPGDMR